MDEHKYAKGREKPKVTRERHNCCVPQCSDVKTATNHLHYFPKDLERRKKWAVAIKTGKAVTNQMQVCSKHFKPEDYIKSTGTGKRLCLKPTAVPSEHLPQRSHDALISSPLKRKLEARADRAKKRAIWIKPSNGDVSAVGADSELIRGQAGDGACLGDDDNENNNRPSSSDDSEWVDVGVMTSFDEKILNDVGVQVDFQSPFITSIVSNDSKLFTATGLHSVKLLDSLVICFDKVAPDSPRQKFAMCCKDRIILTMMRMKLAISFSSLAVLFDIPVSTCCNYFYDTVGILSKVLKCMVFWPEKEDVLKNMPKCFGRYKCTRVVLDCFEVPIEKSKCIKCRVRSYSHYKKNHTAKFLVIMTPSGLISHMCPVFGGRASDKFMTQHSGIYQLCDPGDGIMVDKGYDIDQECQSNFLKLIRPPFLKKSRQFTRAESVECARIARARVHVERLIQRIRQYHILKFKVPRCIVPYLDEIALIVSALVNLGPPILARDKY